jgi:hypothetical protein
MALPVCFNISAVAFNCTAFVWRWQLSGLRPAKLQGYERHRLQQGDVVPFQILKGLDPTGISERDVSQVKDQPHVLTKGMQVTCLPQFLHTRACQSPLDAEPDNNAGRIDNCYPQHFKRAQLPWW